LNSPSVSTNASDYQTNHEVVPQTAIDNRKSRGMEMFRRTRSSLTH
jgi:hypothetical protein